MLHLKIKNKKISALCLSEIKRLKVFRIFSMLVRSNSQIYCPRLSQVEMILFLTYLCHSHIYQVLTIKSDRDEISTQHLRIE